MRLQCVSREEIAFESRTTFNFQKLPKCGKLEKSLHNIEGLGILHLYAKFCEDQVSSLGAASLHFKNSAQCSHHGANKDISLFPPPTYTNLLAYTVISQ